MVVVVVVAQSGCVVVVVEVPAHSQTGCAFWLVAHDVYVHSSCTVPQNVGYSGWQPLVVVVVLVEVVVLVVLVQTSGASQLHNVVVVVLVEVVPPPVVVVVLVDVAAPHVLAYSHHSHDGSSQYHLP